MMTLGAAGTGPSPTGFMLSDLPLPTHAHTVDSDKISYSIVRGSQSRHQPLSNRSNVS